MPRLAIVGFKCSKKDENTLIERVQKCLAKHKRTTSKTKNVDLLSAFAPLSIKHCYWNLNKETATFFQIYPNESLDGSYFFPDRQDCGWLMYMSVDPDRFPDGSQKKGELFLREVISSAGFPVVTIRESDGTDAELERGVFR